MQLKKSLSCSSLLIKALLLLGLLRSQVTCIKSGIPKSFVFTLFWWPEHTSRALLLLSSACCGRRGGCGFLLRSQHTFRSGAGSDEPGAARRGTAGAGPAAGCAAAGPPCPSERAEVPRVAQLHGLSRRHLQYAPLRYMWVLVCNRCYCDRSPLVVFCVLVDHQQ